MKGKQQPPGYFSDSPVKNSKQDPPSQPVSPYLKAVLSGSLEHTGRVVRMAISDKLAAIRYIKESNRWRNHFCRG
jgi:hypothetical protein